MRLLDIQEQLCAKLPTHRVTSFGQVSWFPAAYVSYNGVSVAINLRKLLISWRKLLTIGLLLLSQISGYRGILLGLLNRLPFDSCHGSMKFLSWSLAFQSNFLGVMRSRTRKLGHAHESWVMRKKFGSRARNLGHARESWVTHEKVGSRTKKFGHARESWATHEKYTRVEVRLVGLSRQLNRGVELVSTSVYRCPARCLDDLAAKRAQTQQKWDSVQLAFFEPASEVCFSPLLWVTIEAWESQPVKWQQWWSGVTS